MTANEWIAAWRARGYWCQTCPACGWWYAQKRRGRRSFLCGKARCAQWRDYQRDSGRAPSPETIAKWKAFYGDAPRSDSPKKSPEPTFQGVA